MHSILEKIVVYKRDEVDADRQKVSLADQQARLRDAAPVRDFLSAINASSSMALIAEVKKASPSKGVIRADFDPIDIARQYEAAGADCISVLTDTHFFQGHLDYLTSIRSVVDVPLLRKDFVIDPYQVYQARAAGADAVLLIAECLSREMLIELHRLIYELGMTALVEFYDYANLDKVMACDPKLVGVNNRDLNTFEVNLQHSMAMRRELPENLCFVSESGIDSRQDMEILENGNVDAVLVGESLMRSDNIGKAIHSLRIG